MKNLKAIFISFLSVFVLAVSLPLLACNSAPKYKKFNSFTGFENFAEGVVAIDVKWDLLGSYREFTIEDKEQVKYIVDLYTNTTMKSVGKEPPIGDNGSIKFIYENGSKINASLHLIKDNKTQYYYSYPDSTIYNYIEQIGKDMKVIP